MHKIFITGASGFVGQHLIDCLSNDYFIIGLTSSNHVFQSTEKTKYYSGDINNNELINKILTEYKPDVIVHLAAKTTTWFKDVHEVFKVNLSGTIELYESVLKLKSQDGYNPKILYISSSEVYGKTINPDSIDEKAPFFPVNHYASSKASADRVSYEYTQSKKLNIVVLRAFTHTGPGQRKGFFVPDMVSQIVDLENSADNNEILVGNLDAVRDYLDVRDVVRAYRLIIEKEVQSGEVFNICSGQGVQVRKILDTLLELSHKKINIKTDPARMRPSDVPVFIGDNKKLKEVTGWQPEINLKDTLQETLEYWRKNNK